MTRIRAFLVHLGISLAIFLALAYLIVFIWYPDFFFSTDGGWQGMRIIFAVDLVLGPALTLIVFKPGKPGLKFDLTVIGVFQGACLIAGTYVVYSERPLAMVYVDGQFYSMSADDYTDLGLTVPELSDFPGQWPKWVTVNIPEDPWASSEIRKNAMKQGTPLRTLAERYVPFSPEDVDLEREAYPLSDLLDRDQMTQQIPVWLAEHGGSLEDYAFIRFATRYRFVFLGISQTDLSIKGILETPAPF